MATKHTGGDRRAGAEPFKPENTKHGTSAFEAQAEAVARDLHVDVSEGERIPDDLMLKIADAAFEFCLSAAKTSEIELADYQQEFGRRVVRSLFFEDADELTALMARQSGKTETLAVIVSGLMVLMPALAKQIRDERITKFARGIHIGIFAPSYNTVSILCSRIRDRLWSVGMREIMQDEELGIDLTKEKDRRLLTLPNGSKADAHSTNPRVPIEGWTYHLIICDETQEIPDWRLRKSIHPMGSRTAATLVKLGTPRPERCEFYEACQRNKRHDLGDPNEMTRRHFEYDWKACARSSRRYRLYVEKEKERLGEESDDFRISYRLHWILERSQYVSPEELGECSLDSNTILRMARPGRPPLLFHRSNNLVTFDKKNPHVAGLDIGRSHDSTVLTVSKVFWDSPARIGDSDMFYMHVANWLEIHGDNHEEQYPQIISFLQNYRIDVICVDATGRGDPIYDRLAAELRPYDIQVIPYVFNQVTKHTGYTLLQQEIKAQRFTWPAGRRVRRTTKYKRFTQQFEDLEKSWRGKYMVVEAPQRSGKRLKDAHDDYPDSLMLTLMATQDRQVLRDVEVTVGNPFVSSRRARGAERGHRSPIGPWWRG